VKKPPLLADHLVIERPWLTPETINIAQNRILSILCHFFDYKHREDSNLRER
jgi:hypothetical protein